MSNEIKPTLVLQSPLFTRSGYGSHSADIAKSILRWGKFDLKIVPTKWGTCPQIDLDNLMKTDIEWLELYKRVLREPLKEQPEVFVQISIPTEFQPIAKYNIGITAGIETTLPKCEWLEGLNRMNYNIVPSKFSKDVFEQVVYTKQEPNGAKTELKSTKPMDVLFEGADLKIYGSDKPIDKEVDSMLSGIPEKFAFLFVGHWLQGEVGQDRKDVSMLVKTFCEIFKNRKDAPALILKTSGGIFSHMDKEDTLKKINIAKSSVSGNLPNVYLVHGDLTDEQMNSLYNHKKVKAHVSFTKGEGFGRPLLEASLSGKPVIVSNWSGHLDFLNKEYSVLLDGSVGPVHRSAVNDFILAESNWFTVNYSLAAKTMIDVYENYEKYLKNSEKLRVENSEKFSLDKMQDELVKLFDVKIPQFPKKHKFMMPQLKKLGKL